MFRHSGNLIVNGSFEDPAVGLAVLYTGLPLPTGWQKWPGSKDCYYRTAGSNLFGPIPNGGYALELCGNSGIASFYQNVSTVAGVPHTLTYTLGVLGVGSGPTLNALVYHASNLNTPIAQTGYVPAGNWRQFSLTFTPAQADIVIRFIESGSTNRRDPLVANVQLTIPNSPPVANAGGPYEGAEGLAIALNGSASYDPDGNPLTYNWTVSDPAVCAFDDPTAVEPILTCNDNGDFPADITVNDGIASDSDETAVYVQNLPPEADLNNDGPIYAGSTASVSFSNAYDFSSVDTAAGFHYTFDCSGASLATATYATSGTSASTSCSFANYGIFSGKIMDKDGGSTEYTTSVTVLAWTTNGFFQPVDMGGVWNTVKNGSTVPLKFEVFAGSTELTSTSIVNQPLTATQTLCSGGATDDIELLSSGSTSLRYDTTAGQFIYNWQTPKKAGYCYVVTVKLADGSTISANFKLK